MEIKPNSQLQDESSILEELRKFWGAVRRRQFFFFGAFGLCFTIGLIFLLRTPKIYKAKTLIMIERAAPTVLGNQVQNVYDLGARGYWESKQYYRTQYQIIESRKVLDRAARELRLEPKAIAQEVRQVLATNKGQGESLPMDSLPAGLKFRLNALGFVDDVDSTALKALESDFKVFQSLRAMLAVEALKDSSLVAIGVEHRIPEVAAKLADAIALAYIESNLEQKTDVTHSAVAWLSNQLSVLRDNQQKSERALYDFKKENNIVSVSLEGRQTMILETLNQLNERLSATHAERLVLESERDELNRILSKKKDPTLFLREKDHTLLQDLKRKRFELQELRAELNERYTAKHPKLVSIDNKIQTLEKNIKSEIGKIRQGFDQEFQIKQASEDKLRAAIASVKTEALELNQKEITYKQLSRKAAHDLELLNLVQKRQKESELTQMLKVNNIRLLEKALVPQVPIKPRIKIAVIFVFLLSVLIAFLVAIVVNLIDNTVKTQNEIEGVMGLPFLGILPVIQDEGNAIIQNPWERDFYIVDMPRSAVAECARSIRTNLLFMSTGQQFRTLMVTSSGPKEGKSTTVCNLAATMAESGSRTVVVDTDLRRPRLHKSFRVDNEIGLTSCLLGEMHYRETVRKTRIEGLDFIASGPIPPNPAELLHTEQFKQLVEQLTEDYDRVIFDSPPVSAVADPLILTTLTDGVVFVVQAHKTTLPAAQLSRKKLQAVGANFFGVVLNDVDLSNKHSDSYYYHYYQYYRKGYYADDESGSAIKA